MTPLLARVLFVGAARRGPVDGVSGRRSVGIGVGAEPRVPHHAVPFQRPLRVHGFVDRLPQGVEVARTVIRIVVS